MSIEDTIRGTRRTFIKRCASAGVACAFGIVGRAEADVGDVYPGWRPGELDLHFVYTGCGENMFYRLPDGTSILNDTGEFYRPRDIAEIPLLPSPKRLGGEWVSRYLKRVYGESEIDYLVFSHWHADHIGHSLFDVKETPDRAFRCRTFADGMRGNGFMCVAQDFRFRRYFDHQYPARGVYKTQDSSMELLVPWVEAQRKKGLLCEPFKVGALNQIALQHDPGKYANFSIRNICANGRLWDGADGEADLVAEYVARTGRERIPQNALSLGFVMQYGKFRFWSGGDVQNIPASANINDDTGLAFEDMVGRRVGQVTVCKTNHHGCSDAMSEAFVRAVRARAYVSCIWCPGQFAEATLSRMASRDIHIGYDPVILPNLVPESQARRYKGHEFMKNVATTGYPVHVVVKVFCGGDAYRIYLLDARDESMRVSALMEGSCA